MSDIEYEKTNGKRIGIDLDPKEWLMIIIGSITAYGLYLFS